MKKDKLIQELLEFGIININKPSGPTSFNVSDFVRKKLKLRKTSHFGTLDPRTSGVLPIALNRACKLSGYFIGEDKEYVGIMRIHKDVALEKIKKIIKENFVGKIRQLPPVRSRVKRQIREREIKKFRLLEKEGKNILFHIECQAGTYIRKICSDLGDKIGIGAHMLELRRTRAGIFEEDDKKYPCISLYDFEKAVESYDKGNDNALRKIIIPAEIIKEVYEVIELKKDSLDKILTGKPIYNKDLVKKYKFKKGAIVCAFHKDRFVGMYNVVIEKEIFALPKFVMQPISSNQR